MQILYEEKLSSIWITLIFLFIALFFLFLILYQVFIGPLENNSAPNWVLTIIFLVFLFLSYNFIRLVNQITPEFLIISYGIIKHKIPLGNIEEIKLYESSFLRYGGWGLHFGRSEGKRYIAYTIPGASNLTLQLNKGRFRKIIFSTKYPNKLIDIINEQIAEKEL